MKLLAWYALIIESISVLASILAIGEPYVMTPPLALLTLVLTIPIIALAIVIIRQPSNKRLS
jgi:hypothetical protein